VFAPAEGQNEVGKIDSGWIDWLWGSQERSSKGFSTRTDKDGTMRGMLTCGMLCFATMSATGCALAQKKMQDNPQGLLERLAETGGRAVFHSDVRFGPKADRVKMVYIPRSALDEILPTSLDVFPNLEGLMIINPGEGDRPEEALTGCLVDGAEDLAKLESAYQHVGWITGD
jgi:hypothetical protein